MLPRMATMVHEVLAETVAKYGDRAGAAREAAAAAGRRSRGARTVATCAAPRRALIKLGVEPGKGVSLIGQNSPEWLIADVGAILAGAMPAGIYTTNSAEQVRYITDHCEAKVSFADTPAQVAKFVAEKDRMPRLEVVVQMTGKPAADAGGGKLRVLGWEEFLALGDDVPEAELEARMKAQKPDDVCTLIYTSGTTGEPKAVMITHTNLVWTAGTLLPTLKLGPDDDHRSATCRSATSPSRCSPSTDRWRWARVVYFAESIEKLGENLAEVRPTVFMGVPRVWEKIQAKMMAAGAKAPPMRKKLVAWARKTGLAGGYAEQRGEKKPLALPGREEARVRQGARSASASIARGSA